MAKSVGPQASILPFTGCFFGVLDIGIGRRSVSCMQQPPRLAREMSNCFRWEELGRGLGNRQE